MFPIITSEQYFGKSGDEICDSIRYKLQTILAMDLGFISTCVGFGKWESKNVHWIRFSIITQIFSYSL